MFSTTDTPKCALCDGTGWRAVGEGRERRVTRCACRGDATAARVSAALPELYREARMMDFVGPLQDSAQRWLEKPTCGLLLMGPNGAGKTHLAAAIVRARIESRKSAVLKFAADFYRELRATFNSPDADATELAIMSRLTDAEFLVLDDIGAGSLSDFERRSTLDLLECRLTRLRPTVVTTNLTVEQIGTLMDERISSRLSAYTRIAVTGHDRRAARK